MRGGITNPGGIADIASTNIIFGPDNAHLMDQSPFLRLRVEQARKKAPCMSDHWTPPNGHPLTVERAKELINGDLGEMYRVILSRSCAPIYWHQRRGSGAEILNSGTVTFVRTPKRLMAVTAAHVIRCYEKTHAAATWPLHLQVMSAGLNLQVIGISDELDLATLAIDDKLLSSIGKEVEPLSTWPPRLPQERRGILLAGYPAVDRLQPKPMELSWGLFTALCIARNTIRDQITWVAERSSDIKTDLPPKDTPNNN